jgi:hypothetical protein
MRTSTSSVAGARVNHAIFLRADEDHYVALLAGLLRGGGRLSAVRLSRQVAVNEPGRTGGKQE